MVFREVLPSAVDGICVSRIPPQLSCWQSTVNTMHAFNFDETSGRLAALHQVALGSQAYCQRFLLSKEWKPGREYEWWEYAGPLKSLVSTTLIEAAVKFRMLEDFVRSEDPDMDYQAIAADAIQGLVLAVSPSTSEPLSLRQTCNKIIHATGARMRWESAGAAGDDYEYWSGVYALTVDGTTIEINVPDWCTSGIRFLSLVQERIDWSSVQRWEG